MNEEIDLRACLKIINQRKKFIILGTCVCAALAGAVSFLMPKSYEASLIMEVGKIYLPPKVSNQGVQFIEDLDSTVGVIKSEATLAQVRRHLGLDVRLEKLKKSFTVTTIVEEVFVQRRSLLDELFVGSPMIEIKYEGKSPAETVGALNFLAEIIIKQHGQKYQANRKALEENIKSIQEKIIALEKQIAAQTQYLVLTQNYMEREWESTDEFARRLRDMKSSPSTPLEVLFLQSSSLIGKMHVTDLTRFKAEIDQAILNAQNQIADSRIEMVDLKSRIELSSPTEIRSPAILPERPSKPIKALIVAIGGVLGLALTTLIAFFRGTA